MTHPTDKVRLPKRSRSEEAAEQLDTAAIWLAEIDQVLSEARGKRGEVGTTSPEVLVELNDTSEDSSLASHVAPRQAGELETD
jgi:hypothetical protein